MSACLVIAATLVVLDFYLSRYMAQRQVETVQQQLAAQARLVGVEAESVRRGDLEAWARSAGTRAQARVTIIDPKGLVLADSQHDPETMENHAGRPEIREALQSGSGTSIRHSATLGRDLCYFAVPLTYEGNPRHVIRLAVPLEDLASVIAAVRWRILGASFMAGLAALMVAYFFSRSFTRRINRLRVFAEGLVEGGAPESLGADAEDELGALARSLDRAATQIREFVDRLSLESARRQAILASMVEGVLVVDNELRVIYCNESFARAAGVNLPITDRMPVLELVRDPDFLDELTRVMVSQEPARRRLGLASMSGRTFEVQAAPLTAAAHRGAVAILHDVTDLERLERVRKDFVANVSHELRTPLTAIRGYAETLLEGAIDDRENNRRFLEIIRAHSIRLNNIASDLLTLSELEAGKALGEPERISLRAALETALGTVEAEARVCEVAVRRGRIDDVHVSGDRMRLEQVFINLLDNAVKFNRKGGQVAISTSLGDENRILVSINDTGIGIPSEDLSRIFERFYRVDKARSREVGGTGLGLAIVKHIIERMGGSVRVESQLGKGSTFTVVLKVL